MHAWYSSFSKTVNKTFPLYGLEKVLLIDEGHRMMLNINIETPFSIMEVLKDNFKQKRLSFNLTQEGLSKKSDVSLGSLKRFENSGQISLESLLKLALVLECLEEFKNIATIKNYD